MQFEVPNSKLIQFCELLQHVKSQATMPVRLLEHFLGLLDLYSRALGQVVRLMTRSLYACLNPAYFSPEHSLSLSAREELVFLGE